MTSTQNWTETAAMSSWHAPVAPLIKDQLDDMIVFLYF